MPKTKLKIAQIVSEVSPFSKTGGLADVAHSLPLALKKLGHNVILVTPLYGQLIDPAKHGLELIAENASVRIDESNETAVSFWKGKLAPGLPVYFIESKKYFSKRKELYGSSHENARWAVFDAAALSLLSLIKFSADIIHCHDRQTGLIPYYLKNELREPEILGRAKTVFTIHNLVFQLGMDWWEVPLEKKDYGRHRLPLLGDPDLEYVNFVKRAILCADAISTVSEQYREEIMTVNFGQDLHRILKNRSSRLFGIVNGIDYKEYNPNNDPGLYKNYDARSTSGKSLNKMYLQKLFGLPVNARTPLICTTSRVTFQKGFELIVRIMEQLMLLDLGIIVIGAGDAGYIREMQAIARKYPKKLVVIPSHEENQKYETLCYAGSDFFLLPSHHEPCGINQLIAMRYGCIPIVRKVGGLHDTVTNYSPAAGKGNGFKFEQFSEFALYRAIVRALETYQYKDAWKRLVERAMRESNSWEIPAKKYVSLYRKALKFQNGEE